MTALEHVSLETVSGVGWLKFARAPINAFNRRMLDEVEAALTSLAADPAARPSMREAAKTLQQIEGPMPSVDY